MADLFLPEDERDHSGIFEDLKERIARDDHVLVVLDDDPTGTQTVHDVNVYTDWSHDSMKEAFENNRLFFLLTNSRGMVEEESRRIHREITSVIAKAAKETNKKYLYISRGDSTLRGHYPMETDLLAKDLKETYGRVDGDILIPFFKEGGRFTIDDIHYVKYGDKLVPCAETEFARDKTFGYSSSDLKEYIEEKTEGKIAKEDVVSISLEELRNEEIDEILHKLMEAEDQKRIIVNACADSDVKIFADVLYRAIEKGKVFIFRSAASFVKAIGGITDKALLKKEEMRKKDSRNGGLIVVGSHTDKTTRQLKEVLKNKEIVSEEFRCSRILEGNEGFAEEIERCLKSLEENIAEGKTTVVYTERMEIFLENDDKESALKRSVAISDGLCRIVNQLKVEPAFVIAKGGITSADTATKGLKIKKARALGQIEPGVPVWQADENSKFPGIPYIIFPGNVGDDETLKNATEKLMS